MNHLSFMRLSRLLMIFGLLAGASCSDILGFERGQLSPDGGPTGGRGGGAADGSPDGTGGLDGSLLGDASVDDASRADISVDGADAPGLDAADANRVDVTQDVPSVQPDTGSDVVGRCSATTCPTGCCGPNDTCIPTSTHDACGTAGSPCVACAQGQECSQGACRCGPTCTTGCCTDTGACVTPTHDACGSPGNPCTKCGDGQVCDATGKCACNPSSCPNGCCDGSGACVPYAGQNKDVCGKGGLQCGACATGQACGAAGVCECTTTSCTGGCCQGAACILLANQNTTTCGSGGNECAMCAAGQACTSGACSCGGSTCAGCCSSGQCVSSTDDTCGAGGGICTQCQPDQDCNAQGKCVCTAASCPSGCCDANQRCNTSSDATCGVGGAPCQACLAGRTCSAGQCVCNPTSCPTGCCNGNICVTTPGMSTCGRGGGPCKTCVTGQRCDGTDCVCDSTSCTGCCDANKECKTNGQATCGTSGAPCTGCAAMQQCSSSGQCVCNAASCSTGCCDGNTCVPYASQSDASCGTSGMACGSCAAGKTCSKSNNACVTWCGTKTIPSGVAAADYQCIDFEPGLPAQTTWARMTATTGTLMLSTTRASSAPNALQTVAPAPDGVNQVPREAYLQWTVPGTASTIKSISVSAAISPVVPAFSPSWTDEVKLLCVRFPGSGIESRVCLTYTYGANKPWSQMYTGLLVNYQYFLGDAGYTDECPVTGNFGTNLWTNAELRVDMTTGTIDGILDGVSSPCPTQVAPSPDTQAFFQVGSLSGSYVDFAWSAHFDNVVALVRR